MQINPVVITQQLMNLAYYIKEEELLAFKEIIVSKLSDTNL